MQPLAYTTQQHGTYQGLACRTARHPASPRASPHPRPGPSSGRPRPSPPASQPPDPQSCAARQRVSRMECPAAGNRRPSLPHPACSMQVHKFFWRQQAESRTHAAAGQGQWPLAHPHACVFLLQICSASEHVYTSYDMLARDCGMQASSPAQAGLLLSSLHGRSTLFMATQENVINCFTCIPTSAGRSSRAVTGSFDVIPQRRRTWACPPRSRAWSPPGRPPPRAG